VPAAVAIALWGLGPASGGPRPLVGFNDNAVDQGVGTPRQDADLLARLGARIDRVQFSWQQAEPQPGKYRFGPYDAIYRADLQRGVRPLFIFGFAPPWASGRACDPAHAQCLLPPTAAHIADARRMAGILATRYPRLAGIEIWNEPNLPAFWGPRPDVGAYVALLKACYESIKRADRRMPVAGGSLSPSPRFDSRFILAADFLRGIYRRGGGAYMDAISLHPYPQPSDTNVLSAPTFVEQARRIRDSYGDRHTPLWVTETGISTTGPYAVTEGEQVAVVLHLYEALRIQRDVRMILFHTLIEPPFGPGSDETGYGFVKRDMRPKPAFCALGAALGRRRTAC
jgi:hypothetical protein